jgi:hypothetical protein
MSEKRALLVGHFTTVGDTECLEIVCRWLDEISVPYDVAPFFEAVTRRLAGAKDIRKINAGEYTHLVMICGPVWAQQLEKIRFPLERFANCVRVGINLTMVTPVDNWNPFDVLLERDSDRTTRPDLSLFSEPVAMPVVGRCLVHRQSSYRGRERHGDTAECFERLIRRRGFAAIDIDTVWTRKENPIQSAEQLISVLRRVDLLLTNRLHGLVFGLKAGVPVLAIDAITGTAKVTLQARVLDWPACLPIDDATDERMDSLVDWCLTDEAKAKAQACRSGIMPQLQQLKAAFLDAVVTDLAPSGLPPAGRTRGFRWLRWLRN